MVCKQLVAFSNEKLLLRELSLLPNLTEKKSNHHHHLMLSCAQFYFSLIRFTVFWLLFFFGIKFFLLNIFFFLNSSLLWCVIFFRHYFLHTRFSRQLFHSFIRWLIYLARLSLLPHISVFACMSVCVYLCEHRKIVENLCVYMSVCVCVSMYLVTNFFFLFYISFVYASFSVAFGTMIMIAGRHWTKTKISLQLIICARWFFVLNFWNVNTINRLSKIKEKKIYYFLLVNSIDVQTQKSFGQNICEFLSCKQFFYWVENSNGKLFRFALIFLFTFDSDQFFTYKKKQKPVWLSCILWNRKKNKKRKPFNDILLAILFSHYNLVSDIKRICGRKFTVFWTICATFSYEINPWQFWSCFAFFDSFSVAVRSPRCSSSPLVCWCISRLLYRIFFNLMRFVLGYFF